MLHWKEKALLPERDNTQNKGTRYRKLLAVWTTESHEWTHPQYHRENNLRLDRLGPSPFRDGFIYFEPSTNL